MKDGHGGKSTPKKNIIWVAVVCLHSDCEVKVGCLLGHGHKCWCVTQEMLWGHSCVSMLLSKVKKKSGWGGESWTCEVTKQYPVSSVKLGSGFIWSKVQWLVSIGTEWGHPDHWTRVGAVQKNEVIFWLWLIVKILWNGGVAVQHSDLRRVVEASLVAVCSS